MMFLKTGNKELQIVVLQFANDEEKMKMMEKIRGLIMLSGVTKYWVVMEAWVSDNPFIRPRHDANRKEAIIISEYEKGEIHRKMIQMPFGRENGRPVWLKHKEILMTSEDSADRWNFFMEDVMDERMVKIREREIDKKIKEAKKEILDAERKKGATEEEIKEMSKTFDRVAEKMKKKYKMRGDEWLGGV